MIDCEPRCLPALQDIPKEWVEGGIVNVRNDNSRVDCREPRPADTHRGDERLSHAGRPLRELESDSLARGEGREHVGTRWRESGNQTRASACSSRKTCTILRRSDGWY